MSFKTWLFAILILMSISIQGQETVAVPIDSDTTAIDTLAPHLLERIVPNSAFRVGEKLTFKVRYGWITAGEAIMEVDGLVNLDDSTETYHIITTARSANFFDSFYKVRDKVETFIDTKGLFPWRYQKSLREGSYKFDLLVNYNQRKGIAEVNQTRYHNDEPLRVKKKTDFTLSIPEYVMDVLSSFYYIRSQKLEVGYPIYMSNHDNKKIYDLQVIIQKRETIKVKAGKFKCIKVQPRLKGDAIFQQKGEMWIWLTDDEFKIPVQVKSKIAVGSITLELKKIEGINLPIQSQIN